MGHGDRTNAKRSKKYLNCSYDHYNSVAMRTSRILLDNGACAYHCVSRVAGREHLFTVQHKEKIQDIILNSAGLLGAHLINFVVMSNHVHILVQIPPKDRYGDRTNVKK